MLSAVAEFTPSRPTRIIHECFCCNRGFSAATSLAASFARPAVKLAPPDLTVLFQVRLSLSGLRVPVSPCDYAISPRTSMNNAGSAIRP